MNTVTDHLMIISGKTEDELNELKQNGYEEVPENLSNAAKQVLKNKKEAYVSMTSNGKLATWAKKKRKSKKKLTKKSRKNNR